MHINYKIVIYCALLASLPVAGQNNDSLIGELNNNTIADTVKLQILTDLSWNFLETDLQKARGFAQQELTLANKNNNQRFVAQACNDLGLVLIRQGRFREALVLHHQALAIRKKLGRQLDMASSYSKIGLCYTELTDFVPALEADLKALDIFAKTGQKSYQGLMLANICEIYTKLQNYRNISSYARRAYALAAETNDEVGMGRAQNYIAGSYEGDKNFDAAIKAQEKALRLFTNAGDSASMAASLNNLAYYNRKTGNNDKAIGYYKNAVTIAEKIGDGFSLMGYYKNLGAAYVVLDNLPEGEKYLFKASSLVTSESMPEEVVGLNRAIGDLYVLTNRGKAAFAYYDRANRMKDSLFSGELTQRFSDMEVKYEADKKATENLLLQNENDLQEAELARSRAIQLALAVGVLLVAAVFFLLYNRSRLKQKQLLDAELLRQKQLRANAVIEAEEKERTRIARELHDGIGQQLSAARLNVSGLQSLLSDKWGEEAGLLKNALELLDDSVKEVRQVSHQMMANSLLRSGLAHAVREFLHRIGSRNLKVSVEIIGLAERIEPSVEIVLFRILQEVVNNIVRHARATEITLQMVKHDTELSILVEDNGIGFNVGETLNNPAGIGIRNIRSRVEFLNGEVSFDSYPGKGTTVDISVPLD